MITSFLMIRFIAEALLSRPIAWQPWRPFPENKVYMATALSGLLRSVANAVGTAVAAVMWDQALQLPPQQYAEDTPVDSFGFAGALSGLQETLQWSGRGRGADPDQDHGADAGPSLGRSQHGGLAGLLLVQCMAGDLLCLFPALPFWRRRKYQAPSTPQTAAESVQGAGTSKGDPKS